MYKLLTRIYHKFSRFGFIRKLGQVYRDGFLPGNISAYFRMKKLSKVCQSNPENVVIVFLVQVLTIWNKIESVVDAAVKDDRFQIFILVFPDDITQINKDTYAILSEKYGEIVINAQRDKEWYPLEELHPDYVFYQRPYDTYLPKDFRSSKVSRYAKICYLNYGYNFTEIYKLSMAKIFFRNVYLFFAEADFYKEYNERRFPISHKKMYRKSYSLGYPSFQYFMENKPKTEEEKDTFRVMWTPRWSEDIEVGGSNFFRFKDKLVDFITQHEQFSLIFRPHPMLFMHSKEVGRMTEEDVEQYLNNFSPETRLEYDDNREYAERFWNSDVLVTDFSSIIIEYYLTGKPIIYCPSGIEINDFFKDILTVNYVADSWEDVEKILAELGKGNDWHKEEREKKVSAFLGDYAHISERILDAIYDDCFEHHNA